MRALTLVTAALATAAVAACSNPPADTARDLDFESELELALFSATATATSPAVISELELGRREGPHPAARSAPAPLQPNRPAASPETVLLLGEPVAAVQTVAKAAAPSPMPVDEEVIAPVATAGAGDESNDDDRADARRPRGGGPTIIIRGGVSGRDPCKIHMPGAGGIAGVLGPGGVNVGGVDIGGVLGTIGVMINDRAPRLPANRGIPSGGRTGSPHGGGIFRGGIR